MKKSHLLSIISMVVVVILYAAFLKASAVSAQAQASIISVRWSPNGQKIVGSGTNGFLRIVSPIDFNWGTGSPDAAIAADTFSIRWTGKVEPLYSEAYTFYVTHNDGARLWVNGQQVVNNWTNVTNAVTNSGTITLVAGVKYDIVLEYYENTGNASVKLEWQSASQARQDTHRRTFRQAEYFAAVILGQLHTAHPGRLALRHPRNRRRNRRRDAARPTADATVHK